MVYVALYFLIGLIVTALMSMGEESTILEKAIGVSVWPLSVIVFVRGFVKAYLEDRE